MQAYHVAFILTKSIVVNLLIKIINDIIVGFNRSSKRIEARDAFQKVVAYKHRVGNPSNTKEESIDGSIRKRK